MEQLKLTINGLPWEGTVPADLTLLSFLRRHLALTGVKEGCGIGECGACTVILDRRPVNACLMLAVEADGCEIRTIEGEAATGELSTLQRSFIKHHAVQCGFCTPGMIMSTQALLERCSAPSEEEIIEAVSANLCRCTGYEAIIAAVKDVAHGADGGDA